MSKLLFFIIFAIFISCGFKNTGFYSTDKYEDLYVIPLMKPYRLYSTGPLKVVPWMLFFRNHLKPGELYGAGADDQMPVSLINIKRGIIYGYDTVDDKSGRYFVIIPNKSFEKIFTNKEEWDVFLQHSNITNDTFYDPNIIYDKFKENNKSLPWVIR